MPREIARERVEYLLSTFEVFPYTRGSLAQAVTPAVLGRYFYWDAVLLALAEEAGCTVMLSEHTADGTKFGRIIERNPFGPQGLSDAARQAHGL